jgi:antitoxin PrlF
MTFVARAGAYVEQWCEAKPASSASARAINGETAMNRVVSVTKKGQVTIPQDLRKKFGVGSRVIVEETEEGILFKPLPNPEDDFGSLKDLFKGISARDILDEARAQDRTRERRLSERSARASQRERRSRTISRRR